MKRTITAIGALLAATLLSSEALACMPMPPPPQETGESAEAHAQRVAQWYADQAAQDAAWDLARQQRMWDQARTVLVARIERVRTKERDGLGATPTVTLRPVRWLKGQGRTRNFTLTYTEMTSCGPLPAFDALQGGVGDQFVVYVDGDRPRQSTVLNALRVDRITEPRARAALDAPH
ncbi:hypothetical protein U91I_01140 [alpha proteobacterium U9-1i]|nr:hypothetical protein U91I_01140 [alpha proteobacterium U9-1i]